MFCIALAGCGRENPVAPEQQFEQVPTPAELPQAPDVPGLPESWSLQAPTGFKVVMRPYCSQSAHCADNKADVRISGLPNVKGPDVEHEHVVRGTIYRATHLVRMTASIRGETVSREFHVDSGGRLVDDGGLPVGVSGVCLDRGVYWQAEARFEFVEGRPATSPWTEPVKFHTKNPEPTPAPTVEIVSFGDDWFAFSVTGLECYGNARYYVEVWREGQDKYDWRFGIDRMGGERTDMGLRTNMQSDGVYFVGKPKPGQRWHYWNDEFASPDKAPFLKGPVLDHYIRVRATLNWTGSAFPYEEFFSGFVKVDVGEAG